MKNFKLATLTTLVIMTLAGCADKTPTTADFMRMHAQDEKEASLEQRTLAKEWDQGANLKLTGEEKIKDGQESVKSGDKLIKKGNEEMNNGKQNIEQGNKDTIDGTVMMNDKERIFRDKYPDLKLNSNK